MLPFRKIVFLVDYSEPCRAAIPYVRDAMRQFEASLTVLHAYSPLTFAELPAIGVDLPAKVQDAEENRLREFASEAFPGESVDAVTSLGDAASAAHDFVRHQGADLVMMGTHGHGPIRRFLLGSLTAKILHDLTTPVWTGVGATLQSHAPAVPYRSILCAVDRGEEAQPVARAAAALAKIYGAELAIVRAVETPLASPEIDFAAIRRELLNGADFALRELKSTLGMDVPHIVLEGSAAEALHEEALRRKADLIVTGRGHAQASLSGLWSQLYPIIRHAPCPVLSI